jgi:hypothetical protein
MDMRQPDPGHASELIPSCAACLEPDDLDALVVRGGLFLHPACESDSGPSDDVDRIPPSVADAREGDE